MKKLILTLFVLCIVCANQSFAAALKFSPYRVNFDAKERVFTLTAINSTDESKAYRIGLETRLLKEMGGTQLVANDHPLSAVPYLRITPRRVILKPFERQKIRLQYTGSGVVDGDYLAHIMFREVPIPKPKSEKENSDAAGMVFDVKQIVNVAIPVKLTVGDVTSEVDIVALERNGYLQGDTEFLDVRLTRQGNGNGSGFIYGKFKSHDAQNGDEMPIVVQRVPVNIYRNINNFTLRAPVVGDVPLENGQLILTLHDGEGINRPVLDTFVLDLP